MLERQVTRSGSSCCMFIEEIDAWDLCSLSWHRHRQYSVDLAEIISYRLSRVK
jgi:hypothetical protein